MFDIKKIVFNDINLVKKLDKILEKWLKWQEEFRGSPDNQNVHDEVVQQIYGSYFTLEPVINFKTQSEISGVLRIYSEFLLIANEIRMKTAYRPFKDKGRDFRKERIDEIARLLRDDISFMKAQFLGMNQEKIMNEQLKKIDKQIEQIEMQMKVSKYTFYVAIISLALALFFNVLNLIY